MHHEKHRFADPDSIQILGTRQEDTGGIREADVLFDDSDGNHWYITIVTGGQYVADTINTWRESEQTQEPTTQHGRSTHQEPPKFVWNGGMLDDDSIKDLILNAPLKLLDPFLIRIQEEP